MIFCKMYPNPPGEKVTKAKAKELLGIFADQLESQLRALVAEANRSTSYVATMLCPSTSKYGELLILRRGNAFRFYYQPEQ